MTEHRFPGLPDDGCKATYSREQALSREDIQFMSWENPMVTGSFEMIMGSDFGNTTVCTVKLPPLQPGTILVEAIFVLYCAAPKALNLQRFQNQATVRVVIDSNNNDLSQIITPDHLNKLGERVKRHVAQNMIRLGREQIAGVLQKAETEALKQQQPLIDQAVTKASSMLDEEVERLEALLEVNPSIREEEVAHLKAKRDQILTHLQDAQLRMDAIRIAVVRE